jgi:hypothetical protein
MNCIVVRPSCSRMAFVYVACAILLVCFPENFRALCTGEKVRAALICAQAEPAERLSD